MTDLAILVPSRGRPASIERLAAACEKTCRTDVVLMLGLDDDDPALAAYGGGLDYWRTITSVRPRMGLAAWTNYLCSAVIDGSVDVPYLASLGDDHMPVTDGWDEQLITAIEHMGGGFAYPNDQRREDIPEAVIVSAPIVRTLGWMACPALHHWYIDNVWADLGRAVGRLAYLPGVIVRHLHPLAAAEVQLDATYEDAARSWDADLRAYQRWRLHDMRNDIATVRTCLNLR